MSENVGFGNVEEIEDALDIACNSFCGVVVIGWNGRISHATVVQKDDGVVLSHERANGVVCQLRAGQQTIKHQKLAPLVSESGIDGKEVVLFAYGNRYHLPSVADIRG